MPTARDTSAELPPEQTALLAGHEPLLGDASPGRWTDAGVAPDGQEEASRRQTTEGGGALDGSNHEVGFARGVAIGISLFVLIFIHSTNMSGLTMIQGPLAIDLHAPTLAMWFTTSYFISASSLLPVIGRLAQIFSPRAVVLPCVALFAFGSLFASQARSFAAFVAGRIVMGGGGAGIVVMAVVFVIELTDKKTRGVMIGFVNAAFTMGVSVGAAVYGVLHPVVGWRPLFWFQTPITIIAGIGLYLSLPPSMSSPPAQQNGKPIPLSRKLASIDYLGAILLTLTIILFLYSLAGDIHPTPLILSLFSLIAFVTTEFRLATNPIIPLSVLSSRGVLLSCLAQLGLITARWSILFYTPVFMLAVRASPPATAGAVLIFTNLGFSLGGLAIGYLHIRRAGSYYAAQLLSLTFSFITIAFLAVISHPTTPSLVFIAIVTLNGVTTGIALNYALVHILHLSHPSTEYVTTSLLATFRGFGGSFGTSLGGGIFYRVLRDRLVAGFLALDGTPELGPARRKLVDRLLGSPDLVWYGDDVLAPQERHVAVDGYATAIKGVWQAAAVLALVVIVVQAAAGWTSPREEAEGRLHEDEE
ncbi:major facilitator superfamily domain-containing protein [Trichoderma breve]|uniref:Major facilitator superfamily domain-containing protein n=1 Tax=Trichoderma breve TaxID=2034170 RepID=A0A9W9ECW3_9HYPO|nr:major facilitator superfamily domain-containing protein [Trichoderma breve]KAJ4864336.1 major facilitator superfamily domain-containing protein [Trichoderma breve]